MEQKIPDLLKNIEKDLKITILFAVEVGSRAWELDSAESDYDVRFVFYRSLEDYISITKFDDQISLGYDKDLNPIQKEGAFIEMTGFDIFKYFKLLSSCNATAIDWVNSNIVYYGNKNELTAFIENNANMPKIFVQYFCTARGAHKAHITSK
jgi:predicted nucleotidyltransferase